MAVLAVLAACGELLLVKSLGSVLIILGCFGGCEGFFFPNGKLPHSSSAPPKHDCHFFFKYLSDSL